MTRQPRPRAAPIVIVLVAGIAVIGGALAFAILGGRGDGTAGPTTAAATSASGPPIASGPRSGAPTTGAPSPTTAPSSAPSAAVAPRLESCAAAGSEGLVRTCYELALRELVAPTDDPRPVVQQIADFAWERGGFLFGNCHGLMHTVGRTYVAAHDVTLATLMDYLPANNDPGCSAGFSHGLATGVAPQIDLSRPEETARICDAAATRFQRYSCVHGFGHAFMRLVDEEIELALPMCASLGERAAPDCAQGAYHDYWFAAIGFDDAEAPADLVRDPRALCTAQPDAFVRPCWYRAFIDTRQPGVQLATGSELDQMCVGLGGLQRSACITAASVIGPPDPVDQLAICMELGDPVDQSSCVRGAKVQNLLREPPEAYVDLIGRCARFVEPTASECNRWLGKVISVVTDGAFETTGCPRLPSPAAREACLAGARAIDEALETFS